MFRRHRTPFAYAFILLAALAVVWWGLGFASREKAEDADEGVTEEFDEESAIDERGEISVPEEDGSAESQPTSEFRQSAIKLIESDAATFLPESAPTNAIRRIWFFDDRDMYAEYHRAGIQGVDRMVFFAVEGELPNIRLQGKAFYGQSDAGGWELIEGEDALFTKPQKDLYEKNAEGQWTKMN